jgi:3-phenylpropionate/trans-cinnamate dioxygenase ferredoxin reductase subunit
VALSLGQGLSHLEDRAGRLIAVQLGDTRPIEADLLIVGIGLVPEVAVLAEAGADCRNGMEVDARCPSSLPDIFAIGDCAYHPHPYAEGKVRLESVQNANDQALIVAKQILAQGQDYAALPWFWSNQYQLK